jgi:hypothetical protein
MSNHDAEAWHQSVARLQRVARSKVAIDQQSSSNLNGTLTFYQYGVGPRIQATGGRVVPYAQVLAGGVHSRADLTSSTGAPFSAGLLQR